MKLFIMKTTVIAILVLTVMITYRYLTTTVQHDISYSDGENGREYQVDGVWYTEKQFREKGFKRTILE